MDLSNYVLVGRYDLPTTSNSPAPANSELAAEASAVAYNWDTDSLFLLGDEGTSIVQVGKTGQLINSMTLPQGAAALEGLTYVGDGKFVLVEERTRTAVQFTYTADTVLTAQDLQKVNLGTNAGNLGLEGVAYDPLTGGFIFVKENTPQGVFQSTLNFATNQASNGSATTENSANLFDPAVLGLVDIADVFALSALPATDGTDDEDNLLILSQESGRIVEVNRADGSIVSSLDITAPAGSTLNVVEQGHEGLTMDRDGNLYVVNEQGGGADTPQLWVYAPATFANAAPTAIALTNQLTEIAENGNTASRVKVADVAVTDDGIGTNVLSVSGADAAFFEVDSSGLYIKAGTVLDYEVKASYAISVNVDDAGVGATPDASTNFMLAVTDIVNESGARTAFISEVSPWSSGSKNSPIGQDWFELTNTGDTALDITGWSFDDDSAAFGEADPLLGITTIAAGESVIFLNTKTLDTTRAAFIDTWFGGTAPSGLQFGRYEGAGLGAEGDGVYLFDQSGTVQTSVLFGASPAASPFATFDNSAALEGVKISTLSEAGAAGAYTVTNKLGNDEIGSPGKVGKVFISEVAPWSSGGSNSPVGEDWFELTNTTTAAIDITGWRFDDDSASFEESDPLLGVTSLAPGESAIFLNSNNLAATRTKFVDTWFGGTAPANLQFGNYAGAGLGTGGDAIFLFDAAGNVQTGVRFGASTGAPALATFDNAGALEFGTITSLSSPGSNGAFQVANTLGNTETGSPGAIVTVALPQNEAPTAITLPNALTQIEENTGTPIRIKLADVAVTDDGAGFNALSLAGADAAFFEVDSGGLYLKAGTQLDFETKASYAVTVQVDDTTVGAAPDASVGYTLSVTNQVVETGPAIVITEVAPWSSGKNTPVGEDWFELTNVSDATVDISGWRFDDDSASLAEADPLLGITTIAPGESIIFLNTTDLATVRTKFVDTWFGGTAPAGVRFGNYAGAGLGTGGDAIYLFDGKGMIQASVTFGASTEGPFATFDNSAGLNHALISALSSVGVNGAFVAPNDTDAVGSPGTIKPANEAPVASNDSATAVRNGAVRIDVLANDSDADGGTLSVISFGKAANGSVSMNSDGTLAYTPTRNFVGTDSFRYTVGDGQGGESTGTVTVRVANGGLFNLNDTHLGGDGRDTLIGLLGSNFIDGRGGNDRLIGGLGNDVILGGEGNDILTGLLGNDVLNGGAGRDEMSGGLGNDRYVFDDGDTGSTAAAADRITDGFGGLFGRDVIDLSLIDAIQGGGDDAFRFIGRNGFGGNAGELRQQTQGGSTYLLGDTNGDAAADLMIILTSQIQLSSNSFVL